MDQMHKLAFVIVLVLSTNFFAWLIVRVFCKRDIPLRAITRNSLMGICGVTAGLLSIDIFNWLFS